MARPGNVLSCTSLATMALQQEAPTPSRVDRSVASRPTRTVDRLLTAGIVVLLPTADYFSVRDPLELVAQRGSHRRRASLDPG